MKALLTTAILSAFIGAGIALIVPQIAHSDPLPQPPPPLLSEKQQVWTESLRWCESRGVDGAINKVDRDGTPNYGRFQFKPSTFYGFAAKYGLSTTSSYMNPIEQQAIVEHMVVDPSITARQWRTQLFPDCVQRFVGLPPSA